MPNSLKETDTYKQLLNVNANITLKYMYFASNDETETSKETDLEIVEKYGSKDDIRLYKLGLLVTEILVNKLDKIKKIILLYQFTHITHELEENEIKKEFILAYHYENFLINIVSIGDIIAKIINYTYNIEIEEFKCSLHNILNKIENNGNSYNTVITSTLNSFSKSLKPYKDTRDAIVHAKQLSIKEIELLTLHYTQEGKKIDRLLKQTNSKYNLKELSEDHLKHIMENTIDDINKQIYLILKELSSDITSISSTYKYSNLRNIIKSI